jgi:4-aminobutyrate aminotransferase-like enzyme
MIRHRDLRKADARLIARGDESAQDIDVIGAEGSILIAANGRRYIDFVMGWCVGTLGWGMAPLREILSGYEGPTYVQGSFLYRPWVELAQLLTDLAPGRLARCFRATGGSEAVDLALRAAMLHTGRRRFISIQGAYHGETLAALSVGDAELTEELPGGPLLSCARIAAPLGARAAEQLERRLRRRDVAALIMEPVVCNLGAVVPERVFMDRAQALCRKYGTLLIMDEVATGFGHTGELFASEHFGIEPDLLCLAKSMSGGLLGIGATLATEEVAGSVDFLYSTYGWHPLSVEATLHQLRHLVKHRTAILENVRGTGQYLRDRLSAMDFGCDVEVRGKGLAIGVELKQGKRAARIVEAARERGLLLSDIDDRTIAMFPALNVERELASRAMDLLQECVEPRRRRAA